MAEPIRLQKFLARAAVASRREAEQMILDGRISVDGVVVRELGARVDPDASTVKVDGRPVGTEGAFLYVLLYKPPQVMTTRHDPEGRPTVYQFLKGLPPHLAYIGRLDWDAEGALLLTNDGDFAQLLAHPRFKVPKTYLVKVRHTPSNASLDRLRRGVRLDDGPTQPADVEVVEITDKGHAWLKVIIAEGRKNQIKRMMRAVGHLTARIVRTHIGEVSVEGMEIGRWRHLSDEEVASLQEYVSHGPEKPPRRQSRHQGRSPVATPKKRGDNK